MDRPVTQRRKRNWKPILKRHALGYLFILLPAVLFAFYVWVPMVRTIVLSFQSDFDNPVFVGFDNYKAVFADDGFLTALKNTFLYIFYSLAIGYLVPVLLGFLLSEVIHAKGLFRVLLYLPCMISGIAVVFLFKNLYSDEPYSILNVIVQAFGGQSRPWAGDINLIIPLIVLAMTWKGAGSTALIYLSSFQQIDNSLYEASRMDGANPWQRFWRITIPCMKATLLMLLALQIISVFQVFYEPLVIGNKGGPLPNGSMSLMLLSYLYAFEDLEYAKSAATSVILSLIILVFTIGYELLKRFLEGKGGAPNGKKSFAKGKKAQA